MPNNYKEFYGIEGQSDALIISDMLNPLFSYINKDVCPQFLRKINITKDYKMEFYFNHFMISQSRRSPFIVYIYFNYLLWKNKSSFNYIIKSNSYNDLKPYIKDILNYYIDILYSYCTYLDVNWDNLTDSKNRKYKNKYDRCVIDLLKKSLIDAYKNEPIIDLFNLSVTYDIHFKDNYSKYIMLDSLKNIDLSGYQTITVSKETVFYRPYNSSLRSFTRSRPKIRIYDKQKEIISRYYQKLKDSFDYSYDDDEVKFQFLNYDKTKKQKLESDFIEAYNFTQNTLRFEVEFNKQNIKSEFGSTSFFELNIDNRKVIKKYFNKVFDGESVTFKETSFFDQVTKEKRVVIFDSVVFDKIECTGDFLKIINFVIKHRDFLNQVVYGFPAKVEKKGNKIIFKDRELLGKWYNKVSRFRKRGIIRGYGKDLKLTLPYYNILMLINYYAARYGRRPKAADLL